MPATLDLRSQQLDAVRHHHAKIHRPAIQLQLAGFNSRDVKQVIGEPRHHHGLARDDVDRDSYCFVVAHALTDDRRRRDNRAQRHPHFVPENRQERVLSLVGSSERIGLLHQLPAGRRKLGQQLDDALAFAVELAFVVVTDDPDGANRLVIGVKWNQQGLDDPWLRLQCRKTSIGQAHQLGRIAIDAHAAGTRVTRHGAAARAGKHTRDRLPANHVTVEQADGGGVRVA